MSLQFNITLICESCHKEGDEYISTMKSLNKDDAQDAILITTDAATVPGTKYEFRLNGVFPLYVDAKPCSSNVLSFFSPKELNAIDLTKLAMEEFNKKNK